MFALIAAISAVVALAAVLAVVLLRNGEPGTTTAAVAETTARSANSASTSRPSTTTPNNPVPATPFATGPSTTSTAPAWVTSSAQTPYWTVIVSSRTEAEGGRAAAESVAATLVGNGYSYDIFQSDAYTSLRPGYWVTASGRLSDQSSASALALQLKASGYSTAYQRCVGAQNQCP